MGDAMTKSGGGSARRSMVCSIVSALSGSAYAICSALRRVCRSPRWQEAKARAKNSIGIIAFRILIVCAQTVATRWCETSRDVATTERRGRASARLCQRPSRLLSCYIYDGRLSSSDGKGRTNPRHSQKECPVFSSLFYSCVV